MGAYPPLVYRNDVQETLLSAYTANPGIVHAIAATERFQAQNARFAEFATFMKMHNLEEFRHDHTPDPSLLTQFIVTLHEHMHGTADERVLMRLCQLLFDLLVEKFDGLEHLRAPNDLNR